MKRQPRTITRDALRRRAKSLGVAIEFHKDSGRAVAGTVFHEIILTAPDGFVFGGSDVHERIVASHVDGAPIESLYTDAAADLADGVEPCDDADCEICHRHADNVEDGGNQ